MVDNNDKKIKIDNTIKALYEVLEKNKNNPNIKKAFEDTGKLGTEIQEFVKKRVAIYKYPRIIKFVEELPRTSSGKISRARIRQADLARLNKK